MVLATDLLSTPLREKSATGGRYDYQTMWGLALLFQEHGRTADYAIVFEFHDDVALFDSATNPSTVRFFQVKSKDTNGWWTLASLIKREKINTKSGIKTKPSYIDNMFDNINKFSTAVLSADFVSNQRCSFNAEKKSFRLNECTPEHFGKILTSVQESFPAATKTQIELLGFHHTDLSLDDFLNHIKGKLQTFITQQLGTIWFSPEAVYQAIADECRRKATFVGDTNSFSQVIKEKGLTKSNVQEWLNAIENNSRSPDWNTISQNLDYPFSEKLRIGREYAAYRAAALDSADRATQRVRMKILEGIQLVINNDSLSFHEMIEDLYAQTQKVAEKYFSPFLPSKLRAMIIYEIHAYR